MTRVLVLGAGGMLGSMVAAQLASEEDIELVAAGRDGERALDVRRDDPAELLDAVAPAWVVNAVGILKSGIDARSSASIEAAINVNGRFPHRLAQAAGVRGIRIINPATDGVFSGRGGPYDESSPHDATDVYGQSKSLGEAPGEHVVNLRCSIIGPERGRSRALLEWLLAQPHRSRLTGYRDQLWNGITTLHFAQLCAGLVRADSRRHGPVHVVPADVVTKAQLLRLLASAFGRADVEIVDATSAEPADRSLATRDSERNLILWRAAGHPAPPTIAAMVSELSQARR